MAAQGEVLEVSTLRASIPHFCEVVERIEANSWFAGNVLAPRSPLDGFTYQLNGDRPPIITHVPTEPLESLLLHVRKLTMNDAPEQLLKVKKALTSTATDGRNRDLLDLWQKYWRIAFVMPQFTYESNGVKEFMTQYRVYDCFINGRLFHSNDPDYNAILHGTTQPDELRKPNLFLQNIFHLAVSNLCLAAIGLKRYVDNKSTFDHITMQPMAALEFLFFRKKVDMLDDQYRVFNESIPQECSHARWC
jgi:hypothetical protein